MVHLGRYRNIVPDFESFVESIHKPLPVTVRINTLKTDRDALLRRLSEEGVRYRFIYWNPFCLRINLEKPGNLIECLMGYLHVQEEISMVSAVVLDPRPGESVLDLCAAPGSKTTQISQMMENQGSVVANEPAVNRIPSLRSNCERLGAMNVAMTRYDGRLFPRHLFDRVLVDAPCTGQGMARKDPSVLSRWSLKRSLGIQRLQQSLLRRGVELTRPGGTIVYSTCTFAPEENEAVVSTVLDRVWVETVSVPGLKNMPGLTRWDSDYGDDLESCARYYPHQNDTGGFFVAKLIKK